jgi:hypothetical protein
MKQYLEDMKLRTPRFVLPELTEEDRLALGDRVDSYESRLRYHYLNQRDERNRTSRGGNPGSRDADPKMTLEYKFKTQLFWIVSRANNCQY